MNSAQTQFNAIFEHPKTRIEENGSEIGESFISEDIVFNLEEHGLAIDGTVILTQGNQLEYCLRYIFGDNNGFDLERDGETGEIRLTLSDAKDYDITILLTGNIDCMKISPTNTTIKSINITNSGLPFPTAT